MFILDTTKKEYDRIKTLINELFPEVVTVMMNCDTNLEKLGFCLSAPCSLGMLVSREKLDEMILEIEFIEMAYAYGDGREAERKYDRYGCLWDYFKSAKELTECIKSRILECCTLFAFEYEGKEYHIDPFSENDFCVYADVYGDQSMLELSDIENVMGMPYIDGKSLNEVADYIEILDW